MKSLYEALGFRVTHDYDLGGNQIDLLLERITPGVGRQVYVVECRARAGAVTKPEAAAFWTIVQAASRVANGGGILVTTSTFSRQARAFAESVGNLHLRTVAELEDQLLFSHELYASHIEWYEQRPIHRSYVPLCARSGGALIPDIEEFLLAWVAAGNRGCLNILGDYGTGKTTLLERIKYRLCSGLMHGRTSTKPVLIQLRDYHGLHSLQALVKHSLQRELAQEVTFEYFLRRLETGDILLLLDGFDEMTRKERSFSTSARRDNMLELMPLLHSGAPVILSCRPTLFVTVEEMGDVLRLTEPNPSPSHGVRPSSLGADSRRRRKQRLSDHIEISTSGAPVPSKHGHRSSKTVHLELLDQDRILAYLKHHNRDLIAQAGGDADAVMRVLPAVFDLRDLMRRPMMLRMITESLTSGEIRLDAVDRHISSYDLYDVYTRQKLKEEGKRSQQRTILSVDERQDLSKAVALLMFQKGRYQVAYPEIQEISRRMFARLHDRLATLDPAVVADDIRVCTFLFRDADDQFQFTHTSFKEFFLAAHIADAVLAGNGKEWLAREHSPETLYFIAGRASSDEALWNALRREYLGCVEQKRRGPYRLNLANTLYCVRGEVWDLHLSEHRVDSVKLMRTKWNKPVLLDVEMSHVESEGLEMVCGSVSGLRLLHSAFRSHRYVTSAVAISGEATVIEGLKLEASTFEAAGDVAVSIDKAIDSHVSMGAKSKLDCKGLLGGSLTATDCEVVGLSARKTRVRLDGGSRADGIVTVDSEVTLAGARAMNVQCVGGRWIAHNASLLGYSLQGCSEVYLRGCTLEGQSKAAARSNGAEGRTMSRCRMALTELTTVSDTSLAECDVAVHGSTLTHCSVAKGLVRVVDGGTLKSVEVWEDSSIVVEEGIVDSVSVVGSSLLLGERATAVLLRCERAALVQFDWHVRRDKHTTLFVRGKTPSVTQSLLLGVTLTAEELDAFDRAENFGIVWVEKRQGHRTGNLYCATARELNALRSSCFGDASALLPGLDGSSAERLARVLAWVAACRAARPAAAEGTGRARSE